MRLRSLILAAGILSAGLVFDACSPQSVAPASSVVLGVQKSSGPQNLMQALAHPNKIFDLVSSGSLSSSTFDCFSVNVTGDQVPDDIEIANSCESDDDMAGYGFGSLTEAFNASSTVQVAVPSGVSVNFGLFGLYPTPTVCGGQEDGIKGYFLGSVSQTVKSGATIMLPVNYQGTPADLQCSNFVYYYLMGGSVQGGSLDLDDWVSTFSGTAASAGNAAGTGSHARFDAPQGIASDGTYLYVADSDSQNIKQIDPETWSVTIFAGSTTGAPGSADGTGTSASFNDPQGVASDGTNLYIADTGNNLIRQIVIATGAVTTLAGNGSTGLLNNTGTAAEFNAPTGLVTDGAGNLFVVDNSNCVIRKIVIGTGVVTTLAGTGTCGLVNGPGTSSEFNYPGNITTDGVNLYVADTANNVIRQVTFSGTTSTLAGSGTQAEQDGTSSSAEFNSPWSITTDGTNLYVGDIVGNTIRQVAIAGGDTTTIAGTAGTPGYADGYGQDATMNGPQGIVYADGTLYFTDFGTFPASDLLREIDLGEDDEVTTLAGGANSPGSTDGYSAARYSGPTSVTTDGATLYVTDTGNNTIREVDLDSGETTTLAGTAGTAGLNDGTGASAQFNTPWGVTTDGEYLYVTDSANATVRRIDPETGDVTTIAGTAGTNGSADGTGLSASFTSPAGITTDGTNLYVADSGNNTIRQVVIETGVVTTIAGTANPSGSYADGTGTSARFNQPLGLTTDGDTLWVADANNQVIRAIDLETMAVTTLAGNPGMSGSADGTGTGATFKTPMGLTTDGYTLWVADNINNTIREVDPDSGEVDTIAGTAGQGGFTNGDGTSSALLWGPSGLTTDGESLYVIDNGNDEIRLIE